MNSTSGLSVACRFSVLFTLLIFSIRPDANSQTPAIDSLKVLLRQDSSNVRLLIQLSRMTRNTDPSTAKKLIIKAINIARARQQYGGLDSALYEAAGALYVMGNLDSARMMLEQRITLEEKQRDSLALARSYNFLGGVLNELGKKVEALDCYIKAKKLSDKIADDKLKYSITYNIALYYHDDRNKAFGYRLEAYEIAKRLQDYPLAYRRNAEITSVLGNEYFLKKDFATARKFLRESLVNAGLGDYPSREAFAYSTYAEILRAEKNYDSAIYYQAKSVDVKTSIGEKNRLHDSMGLLGEIYFDKGDYKNAVVYLSRAVALSREMNSSLFLYRWLPTLAQAQASAGDVRAAYASLAEYQSLADSVMNDEKVRAIAELETKYETEKRQREIESLKQQQHLRDQLDRSKTFLFIGLVLLLGVSGLAWYFRAKAKEQENIRLTERIDAQNRELSTISLLVNKKNEALLGIKEKLTTVSKDNGDLRAISRDIDREIDFDSEWDTFKYHFEKVHPDFFQKLSERVPSLTRKEQRYCAYFKSNLSTKEIAHLTNTSVRGVQQARYRINQKFGEVNGTLADFLIKVEKN